jgi:hypothetical protein
MLDSLDLESGPPVESDIKLYYFTLIKCLHCKIIPRHF